MTEADRRGPDRPRVSTVLVVDDSSTTRRILRRGLESAGYLVLEAGDGREGLEVCRSRHPDLVLLDVDMPVLDGLATLELMREDEALATTPVLFLTARTTGGEVAKGLDLGADDYLKKPCEQSELVARVSTALRRHAREHRLRARAEELDALSTTDALTGLGNRRHLEGHVQALPPTSPLGVVLLDIDHFKAVNDNHGHGIGDVVLAIVAQRLRSAGGDAVTVVRWGGEEFLAVSDDASGVADLAERLRAAVCVTPLATGTATPLVVTVSAGTAAGTVAQLEQLTRAADAALYRAKAEGRNRVADGHRAG